MCIEVSFTRYPGEGTRFNTAYCYQPLGEAESGFSGIGRPGEEGRGRGQGKWEMENVRGQVRSREVQEQERLTRS